MEYQKHTRFDGRVLMIGCGSIGQGSLPLILRHIDMDPAPIDPQTGFVTTARETDETLYLNRREVQLFGNPPLRYGYLLQIPGTGSFVTLRYSDFVKMLGRANLRVLINNK